jgi:GNAT superfamily N-acetyltransferase
VTSSPDLARDLTVRRATDADRPAVLALLADSLGWARDDTFSEFFDWKHRQNPFGASPAWVAVAADELVGFRTFLRWEFEHPDGRRRRAVRAVDTATAPAYQGRGVFRALTTAAVAELTDEGSDFVFNTPNAQSRPGYLRMGWVDVGRPALEARFTGARGLWRMRTARAPAERWPVATAAGVDAATLVAADGIAELLGRLPAPRGLRTVRSVAYLRWRYGLPALGYRALALDDDPATGVAVFRLRRRGEAVEAGVSELLVAAGAPAARRLLRSVQRAAGADYAIRLRPAREPVVSPSRASGWVPLPRVGPRLTYRGLADRSPVPGLRDFDLALGDVELL